jgi:hypothetical protein
VVSVDSLLDTVVEEMQEKRSQTRTDATAKFLELLTQNYCHDYIVSRTFQFAFFMLSSTMS